MTILGIETSCDDTAIAVVEAHSTGSAGSPQGSSGQAPAFRVLSNVVSGQVETHAAFGGVVPTLAAREHAKNFAPVLLRALYEAGLSSPEDDKKIDLIAVTTHPGLMPSLLVGVHAARALAWQMEKPIIGINHLEGHLAANLLPEITRKDTNVKTKGHEILFPAVALIVSGGHTQLVVMRDWLEYEVIGETRDDAAGEAFDKVAKLIGLPFPGGPPISQLAAKSQGTRNKIQDTIKLPRPMMNKEGYDFSFSGLKTAVLYFVRDTYGTVENPDIPEDAKAALCAEFQQAVVDVLVAKTVRAAKEHGAKTVMLGGGVAANSELRRQLGDAVATLPQSPIYQLPTAAMAVDNGAMIAAAAYLRWQQMTEPDQAATTWQDVAVQL